ncbi:MAG: hypothetical protein GX410_00085 [Elusimicrobia bacterium]|nr:hypothetical protein [Elusimicrobiota bacterium]
MNTLPPLTPDERSLLEDIAETGVHDSLVALKKITRTEWTAFSHNLSIFTASELSGRFSMQEKPYLGGNLNVQGPLNMALLISYPKESVMNLVHFMAPKEAASQQSELEHFTVAEASNILANTFISVIANTLKVKILAKGPNVLQGPNVVMLSMAASNAGLDPDYILTSSLKLESDQINMNCNLAIILSSTGLRELVTAMRNSAAWSEKGHFV